MKVALGYKEPTQDVCSVNTRLIGLYPEDLISCKYFYSLRCYLSVKGVNFTTWKHGGTRYFPTFFLPAHKKGSLCLLSLPKYAPNKCHIFNAFKEGYILQISFRFLKLLSSDVTCNICGFQYISTLLMFNKSPQTVVNTIHIQLKICSCIKRC